MTSLWLALALTCLRGEFTDETVKSANGRFSLAVTAHGLALSEGGAAKWQREWTPHPSNFVVSDSGAWVAALWLSDCTDCEQLELFGPDGKTVAQLKLLNLLSEEELQFIGTSDCGPQWLSRASVSGESLVLEIVQGGNVPPIYDQGPTLRMTVDGKTGAVTRGPPVARPSIADLLAAHRSATNPASRRRIFDELWRKAQLASSRGDRSLCDFFLDRAMNGEDVSVRGGAAQALGSIGTDADLAQLTRLALRGDDGDLETLATLQRRDVTAARRLALRALREKREPELLRQRALVLLLKDGMPELWEAAALGVADASARVRETAVGELTRLPQSSQAFELLLTAAAGTEAPVAVRARSGVFQHYLGSPTDPQWRTRLVEAVAADKLERWGGALVVAAAAAEVRADAAAAKALYLRAVKVLDPERPKQGYWPDDQLWCEAKLRLAQLAADAKRPDEAVRGAQEVLAAHYDVSVLAPAPSYYGGGKGPASSAKSVAQKLVETKGAPLPPPFNPPDAAAMLRQVEERNRIARERAKAR